MRKYVKSFNEYLNENQYQGHHRPPTKDYTPLYDLTNVYPDIYEMSYKEFQRVYGNNIDDDRLNGLEGVYKIIMAAKGNPEYDVTIYRAVPDLSIEYKSNLKHIKKAFKLFKEYKFKAKDVIEYLDNNDIEHNINIDNFDDNSAVDISNFVKEIKELENSIKGQIDKLITIPINSNDWVTLSQRYAYEHGIYIYDKRKDFIIIKKVVKAKEIFSDGNDLYEYGYQS